MYVKIPLGGLDSLQLAGLRQEQDQEGMKNYYIHILAKLVSEHCEKEEVKEALNNADIRLVCDKVNLCI